ncbi:MAG: hypothetical protein JWQ38_146 [Flavipsychrobacter sp.]|nr:hypothetical protein [Flavipsychrobacter sp.]
MKKLFFLLVIIIFVSFTKSMAQSMLKVRLKDNTQQISVAVDNRFFNKRGTSITVGDLPYGSHNLKIYSVVYNRRGKGREELVYEGNVKTYNGMISTFIFDTETGSNSMQEMEMSAYKAEHPIPGAGQYDTRSNNYDTRNNNDQNNQDNSVADNSVNSSLPVASPMATGTLTDDKTTTLKKKVAEKTTDTQKMGLLKDELKKEQITTAQVADIMDWLAFEASKVDFAKWAYDITVDKEYYTDLENKFTYKNSQDDLDKFIKSK